MPDTLTGKDWDILLESVLRLRCTPFLGAGACYGILPLGGDIAEEWAMLYNFPLSERRNLIQVAQYLAITHQPLFPKFEFIKRIETIKLPEDDRGDEPHAVLADLPIPVYITTNYDDFMVQALRRKWKSPKRRISQWNDYLKRFQPGMGPNDKPDVANPVVFHLHGNNEVAQSLVLTEDDYLEFLVTLSRDPTLLPEPIQNAIIGSSLLFIGYSLADTTLRVLHRGLFATTASNIRLTSFTVQPLPTRDTDTEEDRRKTQEYLDEYFRKLDIRVYWGTAREFASDLRNKWQQYRNGVRFGI